jgi:hypothetical protein
MGRLKVPDEDREGLAKLVALKKESIDELLSALAESPPSIDADELAARITLQTKTIPQEDIAIIASTVLSFYFARTYLGYSIPEFAKEVCESIASGGIDDLELPTEECEQFQANLIRILSVNSLAAKIKARTLLRDYERILCDARILTDLRPVFGSNPEDAPAGAGIVHTLRIRYHKGKDLKDVYIVLDSDEVEGLRKSTERAKLKAESLRSVLKAASITDVSSE